jgi:hypothetical protein
MHDLAINEHLVCTDPVANCIGRICAGGNLNLAPLTIGRDQLSLSREVPELFVDALLFNAALPLNEW